MPSPSMNRNARDEALESRLGRLGVRETDLEERFVAGTGPGGQKINKTASSVSLVYRPARIEIHCQDSRSRSTNRYLARLRLCEKLEEIRREKQAEKARLQAKRRYQKRRRSAGEKARIRRQKKARSDKKKLRGRISGDD